MLAFYAKIDVMPSYATTWNRYEQAEKRRAERFEQSRRFVGRSDNLATRHWYALLCLRLPFRQPAVCIA